MWGFYIFYIMKKLISLFLVLFIPFAFAHCSGSIEDGSTTDDSITTGGDEEINAEWMKIKDKLSEYVVLYGADENEDNIKMIDAFAKVLEQIYGVPFEAQVESGTSMEESIFFSYLEGSENAYGIGGYEIIITESAVTLSYSDTYGLINAAEELLSLSARDMDIKNSSEEYHKVLYADGYTEKIMKVNNLFCDNMILQQNKPVTVNGNDARPGSLISVRLYNGNDLVREISGKADEDGVWSVTFEGLSGSYIEYKLCFYMGNRIMTEIKNVVFGQLWIATGQSNMYYTLSDDSNFKNVVFDDSYIRALKLVKPSEGYTYEPLEENLTATWYLGNTRDIRVVSAVGYYFASLLRQQLDVPVGIVSCAVGGTPLRAFLSRETIEANQDIKTYLINQNKYVQSQSWDLSDYRQMSSVYNVSINVLKQLNIAGVLWYQGEQDFNENSSQYTLQLEALYRQFCDEFGYSEYDMPFIYTLFAPYFMASRQVQSFGSFLAGMSETSLKYSKVACITLYDSSPVYNIGNSASHPNTKKSIGEKFAWSALSVAYGFDNENSAPVVLEYKKDGNSIILTFDNVGDGLVVNPYSTVEYTVNDAQTPLRGFTVCGSDGIYLMADAEIVGENQVRVWNDDIADPVSVAYCYSYQAYVCNLASSRNGTPLYMAIPFCVNEPEKPQHISYFGWAGCDVTEIWHLSKNTMHYGSYYPSWSVASDTTLKNSVSLSYDTVNKTQGNAALKIDYSINGEGVFGVSPALSGEVETGETIMFKDVSYNYSKYDTISFNVCNTGNTVVTFEGLKLNTSYALLTADSGIVNGIIPNDGKWITLVVDLNNLTNAEGKEDPKSYINFLFEMQLLFIGKGDGSILIDDVRIGMHSE